MASNINSITQEFNTLSLAQRVEARKLARSICTSLDMECQAIPDDYRDAFWECILEHARDNIQSQKILQANQLEILPMTDSESREFGKEIIRHGKYSGETIDSLPLKYLQAMTNTTFARNVARYLMSPRIKRELDSEL